MQVCATLLVWLSAAAVGQPAATTAPAGLAGVNPQWRHATERNIEEQVKLLVAAYNLDEARQSSLRAEMQRRLLEQVPVERQYQHDKLAWVRQTKRSIKEGASQDELADNRRGFMVDMKRRLEEMPLNEKRVAAWLESQLPAEQAQRGRLRLEELWQRRKSQRDSFLADSEVRSGAKTRAVESQKAQLAQLSEAGKPLPVGPKQARISAGAAKKIDLVRPVEPNTGVQPAADGPKPPPKIDTSQPRTIERGGDKPTSTTGPAEPPLDEWDKYVAEAARKYAFTDAQIAKTRANLADMKNRANEYRRSHADDYAKADSIADAKLRAERLQRLNSPMDAFFEELNARLASLPTLEQRQKAEGGR